MKNRAAAHPHETPHHPHWPLAAVLFTFVFFLGFFSVHESSTGVHIKTGAKIVASGALAASDPYSYTESGKPWTTYSWLSDVLFYCFHQKSGPAGVITVKALAAAAAYALLLPLNLSSPIMAAGVLSLGAMASWAGLTETPAIFDLLMLALMIRILRPRRKLSWKLVAAAAAVELLWANLHGPTAVLGLWLAGLKAFKAALKADWGERKKYAALLAACLAALWANPHGWGLFPHLFAPAAFSAPVWPASSWLNLHTVFVLAGAYACWIGLQQEFFLTMAAASLLALSLLFPGFNALYILSVCPVITLALGHFIHPWSDTAARVARLALLLAASFALHWFGLYLPLGRGHGYGAPTFDGAINYLKANGVTGRMFNEPAAGDALIAGTDRPVFVDSREGFYGEAFMKDASAWPARFTALDEIYRFDYAVVLNRRAGYPARALDQDPWRLVYADDSTLVYVKKSGANAWLVQNKPRPFLAPNRLWPDGLDAVLANPKLVAKALDELDRWLIASPDSSQALLWKAYALDRLKLSEKAQRLIVLAQRRRRLEWDAELMACLGFILENRGQTAAAEKKYRRVAQLARRTGDRLLEAEVLARLAPLARRSGSDWESRGFEERAKELRAGDASLEEAK